MITVNLKAGSIYFLANLVNTSISFITLPVFSRLLTTGEYGLVSTYSSYVCIFQYFMGLSTEYSIRNAYVDYDDEVPQYVSSIILLSIFSSILFSISILIINENVFRFASTIICLCCLLQSFMTYINNMMCNKLMMDNSYVRRTVFLAGPNILSAVLGIVLILLMKSNREQGRIFGYVIAASVFGVYTIIYLWKLAKPRVSKEYWSYALRISLPLIIHGLSLIILSQIDRIMLTNLRSSSETGVYSVCYSLSMITSAFTSAFSGIWIPWFTKKYGKNAFVEINQKIKAYLLLVSILMCDLMLCAPELLKLFTPEPYWKGATIIPALIFASFCIFMYSFCINFELLIKNTKRIASITLIAAVSNVVLNYLFIPTYGILAAAIATLFSYLLSFVLHYSHSRKQNAQLFPFRSFVLPIVILLLISLISYLAVDLWVFRWAVLIFSTALYIWFLLHNEGIRELELS